eukprot:scaffold322264_cov15-Tisochrysis_lutea.AAC.2
MWPAGIYDTGRHMLELVWGCLVAGSLAHVCGKQNGGVWCALASWSGVTSRARAGVEGLAHCSKRQASGTKNTCNPSPCKWTPASSIACAYCSIHYVYGFFYPHPPGREA